MSESEGSYQYEQWMCEQAAKADEDEGGVVEMSERDYKAMVDVLKTLANMKTSEECDNR